MDVANDKIILLFYKDFERDSLFKHDRYLKRIIRPIYNIFRSSQKVSGFYVWYQLLIKALRRQGYQVRLNDYSFARNHPRYPVGILGYPQILNHWRLPNPALLGPGLYDHPKLAPQLMQDPRFKLFIVTCEWMSRMFEPVYSSRCVQWYAGIDTETWADTSDHAKPVDVLIYDKIRWNRDTYGPLLLDPILGALDDRKLTYRIIRYRQYDHNLYRKLLSESKSMIFLCEHETQGMAYQEAMASNVPVLAWDNGFWLDPRRSTFEPNPVPATSVPYFSPECGERFKDIAGFPATFDKFWANLESYQPRRYVQRELSFNGSAELYIKYYQQVAEEPV